MALSTYDGLWKQLLLRCPSASLFLAREWIDYSFRTIWDRRRWSWMVTQGQFLLNQVVNTGLVNVTRGSTTVAGVGTACTTNLVGSQFRIGLTTPIYTILSVQSTTALTLTQPYGALTTNSINYMIYNAYVTAPTDFQSFVSVWDPNYNWQLALYTTQEELNSWDAQRSNTGTSYCVASYRYDNIFSNPPLPMFEIWPHQTANYVFPFLYINRPPDLSDPGASLPRYVRGDVLLEGALGQAARWPGPSKDAPNPYFNLALAQEHDARYEKMLQNLETQDDEVYCSDLVVASVSQMPIATFPLGDSRWLQAHDA